METGGIWLCRSGAKGHLNNQPVQSIVPKPPPLMKYLSLDHQAGYGFTSSRRSQLEVNP